MAQTLTADLTLDLGTFEATEVTVTAVTDAGRAFLADLFGAGAASATMPKSQGIAFAEYVEAHNLTML